MLLSTLSSCWDTQAGGFRPRTARSGPNRQVLGSGRFADGGFLGKMFRRRTIVGLLLLVTVLWPLVHFSGWAPKLLIPNREFVNGGSILIQGGRSEDRKLNVVSHESSNAFKGLLGLRYTDDSTDSGEDLPLQTFEKVQSITRNNESDQLQKSKLDENDEMGNQQTTNTSQKPKLDENGEMGNQQTTNTSQENSHQIPYRQNFRKVNPGNHHMSDARVRQLRDQLAIAKVYLEVEPTQSHLQFMRELHERVTDVDNIIHEATTDAELPEDAPKKLKAMEEALSKGKQIIDNCVTTEKSLRAVLRSTEGQLQAETKQTQFLTQLLAKMLPKGLHCLPLRLSIEYYSLNSTQKNQSSELQKLEDPKLYHYALFSDNVLAAAVVVNSTLSHANNPGDHVFHVVTDGLNYDAMKMWFLSNPPGKASIQVQKVEELTWLNSSYSPVLKQLESESMIEYYFRTHGAKSDGNLKYRNPKYLSILNHLRFYLPEIFPKLNKVVFLDDDVVVQKDLTGLWDINLVGKVNGAVETCGKSFHRFDKYLNFSNLLIAKNFDPHACGWAYGMNVFDLVEWRKQNITDVYHSWQNLNHDRQLWKLGSLPPGLITFYNRTLSLDRSWHVLGLGYDENVKEQDIEHAAVIHYNGNKKPWLEIGMEKYRKYWSKYVNYDQIYLQRCHIIP